MLLPLVIMIVGVRADLDLALRHELRLRSRFTDDTDPALRASGDFILEPTASLALTGSRAELRVAYHPRLVMPQFNSRFAPQLLHRALLAGKLPMGKRHHLFLTESLVIGSLDVTQLLTDPAAPELGLQPVPLGGVGSYLSTTTDGGAAFALSPRTELELRVQHVTAGGAKREVQVDIPLRQTTQGSVKLPLHVARVDTLELSANGGHTAFSNGTVYWHGETTAGWVHRFSRVFEGRAGGGLAAVRPEAGLMVGPSVLLYPVGFVGLTQQLLGDRLRGIELALTASVRPYFDRLTALVYERVQGQATLRARIIRPLFIHSSLLYAQGLPTREQPGIILGLARVSVEYRFNDHFALEGGVLGAWQRGQGVLAGQPLPIVALTQQVLGIVAFTMQERIH